jgi:hypothetical protein
MTTGEADHNKIQLADEFLKKFQKSKDAWRISNEILAMTNITNKDVIFGLIFLAYPLAGPLLCG